MPEYDISGIPVIFPFEPYDLQRTYMEKVIECLENGTNGVLESPTGTGKTLSLLCSTLGWVVSKKAEATQKQTAMVKSQLPDKDAQYIKKIVDSISESQQTRSNVPKIIYSSRTHSQLSQAMHEMKRTSYNHLKAAVIGSRDQLCIHPEVSKETTNVSKLHMCKLKVTTRTCSFYHRVEQRKDSEEIRNATILDIEDLITLAGQKLKACPYFMSKELVANADIIFMPYNYLLDPKARKANNIMLNNTIVILDEAHNVEKMCEESASMQISSTDIALAIEDCTNIMKKLDNSIEIDVEDTGKDFTIDDVAALKELLLKLENVVDGIEVTFSEGSTYPGHYIFEIFQKANINETNWGPINTLIENLSQYLTATTEKNAFSRIGGGLLKLGEIIGVVFAGQGQEFVKRVTQCYKVHIHLEEVKQTKPNKKPDGWLSKHSTTTSKAAKVISYWCFNPGFGMYQLLRSNVRSIILTSGTLAPLKPLISELDIPIAVRLENPHIIGNSQVCVKIVSQGPDKEPLISNYQNRDNPKYITSLGRTILSFCPVCPNGLLIFFPSYPLLYKCQEFWQESGIWSQICRQKQIFVEPRSKDAFITTMAEYYEKINDSTAKGAIFMAVCRGKVSEGLDFADMNGRAVIITGLPFPPLKDPRVVLKKRYLEENRTKENEILTGNEWYSLEAIRAVNQAIGRVIRHRHDYGAILLCDSRFRDNHVKSKLSSWIQVHLNMPQSQTFGPIIGELSRFFRNNEKTLPQPKQRIENGGTQLQSSQLSQSSNDLSNIKLEAHVQRRLEQLNKDILKKEIAVESMRISDYQSASANIKKENLNGDLFSRLDNQAAAIDFNDMSTYNSSDSLVSIHKRDRTSNGNDCDITQSSPCCSSTQNKKRKYKLVPNVVDLTNDSMESPSTPETTPVAAVVPENKIELIKLVRSVLEAEVYKIFLISLTNYQKDGKINELLVALLSAFSNPNLHYILKGMRKFIKESHRSVFDERLKSKNIV